MNPIRKVIDAIVGQHKLVWLITLSVPITDLLCGIGFAITHAKEFLLLDLYADTIFILLVIATYIGMQRKHVLAGYARFGVQGTHLQDFTWILVFSIVGAIFGLALGYHRDGLYLDRVTSNVINNPWLPLVFAVPVFALSIYEEIVFRGYLLKWLGNRSNGLIALIGSSVAFGLFHYDYAELIWFISCGVVLGLVVQRTGALAHAIGLHAGLNLTVFLASGSLLPTSLVH